MKILYLHNNIPNYVADGLFHGLRSLPDVQVVDVPRIDYMYNDATPAMLAKTGSGGNTLYGLLPEAPAAIRQARVFWQRELDDYDLVLFADIGHSAEVLLRCWHQLGPAVASRKLVVVDGYDIPQPFPYFNQRQHLWRYPWYFRLPLRRIKYFKREGVKASPHIQPISMSIPESFIEQVKPAAKKKDWVAYNVDPELNSLFETHQLAPLGQRHFVFGDASSYYHELLASRFGITSRRAGWDCLRHYEYAAKGVVLCFKDLDKKPESAAPHGLDKTNCIIYHHEADLKSQLAAMTTERYAQLQQGGYKWIRQFTTKAVALRFLQMAFPGEHND